jgi:hypothetical protein
MALCSLSEGFQFGSYLVNVNPILAESPFRIAGDLVSNG